jgi:hypothetical protein
MIIIRLIVSRNVGEVMEIGEFDFSSSPEEPIKKKRGRPKGSLGKKNLGFTKIAECKPISNLSELVDGLSNNYSEQTPFGEFIAESQTKEIDPGEFVSQADESSMQYTLDVLEYGKKRRAQISEKVSEEKKKKGNLPFAMGTIVGLQYGDEVFKFRYCGASECEKGKHILKGIGKSGSLSFVPLDKIIELKETDAE